MWIGQGDLRGLHLISIHNVCEYKQEQEHELVSSAFSTNKQTKTHCVVH